MKRILLILTIQLLVTTAFGQKKSPYKIYDSKGKEVSYQKMIKALAEKDVVLFGELHNNPISHWLQYEVTAEFHKTKKLTLGAEMFEADNQAPLNDYLAGKISAKGLDTLARLWPNYKTDYAPLVNFAKKEKLKFIATNIPRRSANLVYRKGFKALDSLSAEEKAWFAPLPMPYDSEIASYKNILKMMGDHGSPELVEAQATKDATMAHFILANYTPGEMFIHYNGAYHSNIFEGIMWYLKQYKKEINCGTISTVSQEDISKLSEESYGLADFIICVDIDMTNSY